MLRKPSWIFTAIPASVVALAAIAASQASHAAAEQCIPAPTGAAPKGQHWYYHSDRATQRKCWYLHETVPTLARPAAAAETVQPAKSVAASRPPADASMQSGGALVDESNTSQSDEASIAVAAPNTTAPLQPASDRSAAQSGTTPWPAPPAPAPAGVQEADAAPSSAAAVTLSNPTGTPATTMPDAADAPHDTTPVSAAAPGQPSTNSMGDDLLIIAAAAALAAAVYAIFALIFRRKTVKTEPADFFARFGSEPDRRGVDRSQPPARKPQSPPVQPSFIPQQLTTPRPLVAPWSQERVKLDQRARPDQPSAAPTRRDLPINLKTAKAPGRPPFPSFLARADQATE